jgi:hypothetical protein
VSGSPPDRPPATSEQRDRLTARDRFLAWLVTGPVGRFAAFVLDLGAASLQGLVNKLRRR